MRELEKMLEGKTMKMVDMVKSLKRKLRRIIAPKAEDSGESSNVQLRLLFPLQNRLEMSTACHSVLREIVCRCPARLFFYSNCNAFFSVCHNVDYLVCDATTS